MSEATGVADAAKKIDFKKLYEGAKDLGLKGYEGARKYLLDPAYEGAKGFVTSPSTAVSQLSTDLSTLAPTAARALGTVAVPIAGYEVGKRILGGRKHDHDDHHGMVVMASEKVAEIQQAAQYAVLAHYKLAFSPIQAGGQALKTLGGAVRQGFGALRGEGGSLANAGKAFMGAGGGRAAANIGAGSAAALGTTYLAGRGLGAGLRSGQQKNGFAITPSGHALDAARARNAMQSRQEMQDIDKAYAEKNPIIGAMSYNPISRAYDEARLRMLQDTARKHERGENAYNPLGGLLTPVEAMPKTAYALPALAALKGAYLAKRLGPTITDAGHEYESALARKEMRDLEREEAALSAYDAANPNAGRTVAEREDAARLMEMRARGLSHTARKHDQGRLAINPFGGMLTPSELAEKALQPR